MSERIKITIIAAVTVLLAAFVIGGFYTVVIPPAGGVWVVNRFTGTVRACGSWCRTIPEKKEKASTTSQP